MKRLFLLLALSLAACGSQADSDAATALPQREAEGTDAIQLEVLEELHGAIEADFVYPDFGGLDWEAEGALLRHRIESGLTEDEFASAVLEMISGLPEGTATYMTREERVQAEFESGTLYEGIGAFVSLRTEPQPRILLLSVIEGSPADQAGLEAHDAVYQVDGIPITEEEGLSVIERVRGLSGTQVRLDVASPNEPRREVLVRREQVSATDTLKGGLLSTGMLYVLVPVSTDETLVNTVAGLLQGSQEQEQEALGLVLDLRISGSSTDWPLTEMMTLLGSGEMGHFVTRAGDQPVVIPGADVANSQSIPMAILVGPDTSGAPEVFAGAMQSTGRAPLVGLPTKGSVLSFRSHTLPDGSLLTFADSSFITPAGNDLSLTGLTPDFLVDADWDEVRAGSDPVLLQAIDLLSRG